MIEENKLKPYEKHEIIVKKVSNAIGYEKVCKTVDSHNLLTICQENYNGSFGKNISKQFQTG